MLTAARLRRSAAAARQRRSAASGAARSGRRRQARSIDRVMRRCRRGAVPRSGRGDYRRTARRFPATVAAYTATSLHVPRLSRTHSQGARLRRRDRIAARSRAAPEPPPRQRTCCSSARTCSRCSRSSCAARTTRSRILSETAAKRGVICASAGNHAQGVALAARRRGIPATIVMPQTTPQIKVQAVIDLGGEVVLHGDDYDQAYEHALTLARERQLAFIHPFDDPDVIAGQGTIGMEILRQRSGRGRSTRSSSRSAAAA